MLSRKEVLERAIKKAVDNGWQPYPHKLSTDETVEAFMIIEPSPLIYIYNHDFAKALWGEMPVAYTKTMPRRALYSVTDWRHHLQQMVIAPDPIQYLGDHL